MKHAYLLFILFLDYSIVSSSKLWMLRAEARIQCKDPSERSDSVYQ